MVIKTSVTFLTMDSDELLIKDTGRILAGLTGNPAYPTPSPTLALVKTGLDEFTTVGNAGLGRPKNHLDCR